MWICVTESNWLLASRRTKGYKNAEMLKYWNLLYHIWTRKFARARWHVLAHKRHSEQPSGRCVLGQAKEQFVRRNWINLFAHGGLLLALELGDALEVSKLKQSVVHP